MAVTPQSNKKANNKGGTPQTGKQAPGKNGTPQGQKGSLPVTPVSQKKATPVSQKKDKIETPKSQKSANQKTPQSQEVKFKTPQSNKGTPQSGKQPKVDTPYPHNKGAQNGSAQKIAQPSPKAATPIQGKPVSNKKRKLSEGVDSDSAEEDFEALLGNSKKLKTDLSEKTKQLKSPSSAAVSGKVATLGQKLQAAPKSPAQSKQATSAVTTKKRQLEESDDEDDEDEDDDDEEDDDESESDQKGSKRVKIATADTVKKPAATKQANNKSTAESTAETKSAAQISADVIAKDLKLKEERDKKTLFVKNLPTTVTEAQIKALHSGILHVRLNDCRWQKNADKAR